MATSTLNGFRDLPSRRIGALAFLERAGEFVIINRSYWKEESRWGLPGGSVSPDELPRQALSRLAAEQLKLHVRAGALLAVDYAPEWPGRFREGINFVYHVPMPTDADIAVAVGYAEVRWVTAETASKLAIDHELLRIEQCLEALRTGSARELLLGVPLGR